MKGKKKKLSPLLEKILFYFSPTSAPVLTKGKLKVGDPCPKCHQGHIIQGKTALGCSRWREGCDFRQPL